MAKSKTTSASRYLDYPRPCVSERQGCKVGWLVYADLITAEKAAEAARWNGRIDASMGYDFGYCSPGSIRELKDGTFEVCRP